MTDPLPAPVPESTSTPAQFVRFDIPPAPPACVPADLVHHARHHRPGAEVRYRPAERGHHPGVRAASSPRASSTASAAVVLAAVAAYHVLDVAYRIFVLRMPLSMLPQVEDFKHLVQDVLFYLGRRDRKASYGRYSYAEKVEYLAVVWGTLIMGMTGFMMWNPLASARWFHGQAIPAAKAAHGGEALLAVLAIILWHFYHVHVRHFNQSIFTGRLSRQEMHEEHPAELAADRTRRRRGPPAGRRAPAPSSRSSRPWPSSSSPWPASACSGLSPSRPPRCRHRPAGGNRADLRPSDAHPDPSAPAHAHV